MGYGNRTLLDLLAEADELIRARTRMTVYDGPFRGMRLLDAVSWGAGDLGPKLLGTYEREVQETIADLARNRYDAVVDIGCAEGYFAVGCARLFPDTPVHGYDTNPQAVRILALAAEANGVADRVHAHGLCDPAELARLAGLHPRLLVISDCEGYEKTLFTHPPTVEALKHADLIIECHDFLDPTITGNLMAHLQFTHTLSVLTSGPRNPNAFPFLAHVSDGVRWAAVQEGRPCAMHWLVCRARRP
ncbi:methyltransferase [Chthonobacter rhizosphaerae]|uniref:methyltransferase n=1 Tax=Chthonobacter rhizosphaerae TaxID=2735553 RepID=UPI0015EEC266|nr:methyltransferase [Chthonobacter rhizosphaerae]